MKESPVFSKTYDLVACIIPLTIHFPRQQRFVLAEVLQEETIRFQGLLIEAAHHSNPSIHLTAADAELDKLRTHIRLCRDLKMINMGQYQHVSGMLVEIGKLLGGWKKSIASGFPVQG